MNKSTKLSEETVPHRYCEESGDNAEKTASYSEADWELIRVKAHEIYRKLAANIGKGAADPEVQKLIEELRQHMTADICNCTPELLKQIANIYVFDKRFTAKVDSLCPGFSAFFREAVYIYCDKLR